MKTENEIKFALIGIKTTQFATSGDDIVENEKIGLQVGLNFKVNTENKQVGVYVKVEYIQNEKAVIIIETGNYFTIKPDSWDELCTEEGNLVISQNMAIHLVGISIGTLRGVLHTKTENTPFNQYFLPTIAVKDLVKKDVELSRND